VRIIGRFAGWLILFGYLGVTAGTIAWIIAFWTDNPKGFLASDIAMTIGFGLAGLGCWRSIRACRNDEASPGLMSGLTRWVGAASLAMAISYAFITYEYHRFHFEPHHRLQVVGGLALVVGFLFAAIGFWFALSTSWLAKDPVQVPASDS